MTMTPDQAKAIAAEFRRFGKRVDQVMNTLDTSSQPCDCCGTLRYTNWQQNQLWAKLEGLAERVETAASTLAKNANNPEFLGVENKQESTS